MSIGRIMYSKMPTKPKLSHFFGFGLPSMIDNTRIHIFMYSIPRRHFTCPFTDLLYVNKRTAIHDSNIYACNRGNLIVLCLAIEIVS